MISKKVVTSPRRPSFKIRRQTVTKKLILNAKIFTLMAILSLASLAVPTPGQTRLPSPPIVRPNTQSVPFLDPAFGFGGEVLTDFGFGRDDQALALAIQPDGKIVAAGRASIPGNGTDFAVARYNPDGSPDSSFGLAGIATVDFFGSNDRATGVAVQPDGKIVVGGDVFNTNTGNTDFGLARLNADGSVDNSFDLDGKVTTDLSLNDLANALILQPDARIVLAGSVLDSQFTKDFALVRYNSDGSLDSGFGSGGKVVTDFFHNSDEVSSAILCPDGSLLAVGFAGGATTQRDFAIARYNTDGSLDTTFGIGGKATIDFFGRIDEARGVAVQPDGRIVLAGSAFNGTTLADFGLTRFNADGTLDTSFGTSGKVTTDFFRNLDEAQAVVVLADGSIIAAGRAFASGSNSDFALVGYDGNGKLNPDFGVNGRLTTDFRGKSDQGFKMVLDLDSRLVVAGAATVANFSQDFAVARYLLQLAPTSVVGEKP
jgi:uncharacterized delta-60 repeat protein